MPAADLQPLLDRLRAGDPAARDALMRQAAGQLERLARKLLRGDFARLRRWEQTDDVFQGAAWRLCRALDADPPATPEAFYRLAALQIRRELIDLARHHYGPHGDAAHHLSTATGDSSAPPGPEAADASHGPDRLAEWAEFHRAVEALPPDERAAADLVWYHGMTHGEAAAVLGVSERTVLRRWQRARLALHHHLKPDHAAN